MAAGVGAAGGGCGGSGGGGIQERRYLWLVLGPISRTVGKQPLAGYRDYRHASPPNVLNREVRSGCGASVENSSKLKSEFLFFFLLPVYKSTLMFCLLRIAAVIKPVNPSPIIQIFCLFIF